MGVMKEISEAAKRNARNGSGPIKVVGAAGTMSATDLDKDTKKLLKDLTGVQFKKIVTDINKVVRQKTVMKVLSGGNGGIGPSQKGPRRSRGLWESPRTSRTGVQYLPGGWHGKNLSRRGADKQTMAHDGGVGGDSGIISRAKPIGGGKYIGITGPRHSGNQGDGGGRHGYNYAHTLEFGAQHKAWDNNSKPLKARPFLGPAGKETQQQQISIIKKHLIKWGKGQV